MRRLSLIWGAWFTVLLTGCSENSNLQQWQASAERIPWATTLGPWQAQTTGRGELLTYFSRRLGFAIENLMFESQGERFDHIALRTGRFDATHGIWLDWDAERASLCSLILAKDAESHSYFQRLIVKLEELTRAIQPRMKKNDWWRLNSRVRDEICAEIYEHASIRPPPAHVRPDRFVKPYELSFRFGSWDLSEEEQWDFKHYINVHKDAEGAEFVNLYHGSYFPAEAFADGIRATRDSPVSPGFYLSNDYESASQEGAASYARQILNAVIAFRQGNDPSEYSRASAEHIEWVKQEVEARSVGHELLEDPTTYRAEWVDDSPTIEVDVTTLNWQVSLGNKEYYDNGFHNVFKIIRGNPLWRHAVEAKYEFNECMKYGNAAGFKVGCAWQVAQGSQLKAFMRIYPGGTGWLYQFPAPTATVETQTLRIPYYYFYGFEAPNGWGGWVKPWPPVKISD